MTAADDADFRDFVAVRSRALLRTAYLLTGDYQLAEDLLQTALTKTYLAWGRIRDRGAVEAYVRTTMVTTQTSWWRTRWRRESPVDHVPDLPTSDGAEAADDRELVRQHLRGLPTRQRAVVVLRYYDDLSEAEIARILGCSTGTVKSHASRALATLRLRRAAEQVADASLGEES
ncbi:MAG: SigE family RNA polymerase sigma factor [Acidothermales bacterium]|nr:SigE family RNA polymerase sigma factor [Acidothermales bacterium]